MVLQSEILKPHMFQPFASHLYGCEKGKKYETNLMKGGNIK